MFGGLEIKGASVPSSQKKDEENDNKSGFSFMSSSTSSAEPEPASTTTPASSGFSFMSSIEEASKEPDQVEAAPKAPSGFSFMTNNSGDNVTQEMEEDSAPTAQDARSIPVASGFGFLSNMVTTPDNTEEETQNTMTTSDESNPVSSSFSFLSSTIATENPTVLSEPDKPKQANESIFSMLSSNLGGPISSESPSETGGGSSATASWGINTTKPPTTAAIKTAGAPTPDILLQTNPSQPTGSGIVFGGAVKPKTVKKKIRGKKIGVGSGTTTTSTPVVLPEPTTTFTHSSSSLSSEKESHDVSEHESIAPLPPTAKTLSDEAEAAANRAHEFISSKFTSNTQPLPSSYMGRYSSEKTVVEDYGDSSHSSDKIQSSTTAKKKEPSDEYKKAAAAAKEAKQMEASRKLGFMGGGMSGGFSSLFKRNFSGGASTSGSRSNLSANDDESDTDNVNEGTTQIYPDQKATEWKVPTYGESNDTIDGDNGGYDVSDYKEEETEEIRGRREEEIRQELEREKELKEVERKQMERQIRQQELVEKQELERVRRVEDEIKKQMLEEEKERQIIREEEATKKRSPGYRLNQIIHQFALISQNTSNTISALRQERNMLLEKRSAAEKQEHLAAQQISQAEKQQMHAAEQEDFELADRLAAVIEQHEIEKSQLSQTRQEIEESIGIIDDKRVDRCHKLLSGFENVQNQLTEFLEERKSSDILDSTELLKKFEEDTKRLAAENERLSADLKTIERDEDLVREERTGLEALISEQTVDIEGRRDEAR